MEQPIFDTYNTTKKILGIDASNIRAGGGLTHLIELLRAANPYLENFSKVYVWGGSDTLAHLDNAPWLKKVCDPMLNRALPYRVWWQIFRLPCLLKEANCDILFAPGGLLIGNFRPSVTMSQNLLPFETIERNRYGLSFKGLRLLLLKLLQSRSFLKANGLIFLTQYARNYLADVFDISRAHSTIIPHGISARFVRRPSKQEPITAFSTTRPFRILYVSTVDVYKHQWNVVEAVARLRREGLPLHLTLIGPAYPPALQRLKQALLKFDPEAEFVSYLGQMPYDEIDLHYKTSNLCVFASSCENLPIILLEGMSSGLPIACSNRGPMPEVLGNNGAYFDPENAGDIAQAIGKLVHSQDNRTKLSKFSFLIASQFNWENCANLTFRFLAETYHRFRQESGSGSK